MKTKFFITFDVESDIHTGEYLGVEEGIKNILKVLDKIQVKATFFVTCDCIEKYPNIFKRLLKEKHEISLHGFRHKRFDEIGREEKEDQIKKAIKCFKKYLKIFPKGFRAPQHSIDNKTLDLLEKYKFGYDSSYTPRNLFQLLFFPKKFRLWFKHFFSKSRPYRIRENLWEVPPTSLIIPFVSLTIRVFPFWLLKFYVNILRVFNANIIFYAHSWDFIELKNSKAYKICPLEKFLKKFDELVRWGKRKGYFGVIN